ncbi:RluA family pseudouridine synthase [Paenibacillus aurantius]|uniref:Pseudouridine synthase n=1 Tax=Paenibacillus aurantius TaxID=2918900 RepID=A0AA96LHF0_9BACL|nr:RluA family pseudouridine synthase [Paenibacillus aurantius]
MRGSVRKGEWLEFHLELREGQSSEGAVKEALSGTDKFWRALAAGGGIQYKGGRVRLHLFPSEKGGYEPEWMDLSILYEDDFCLVADKPAGVPVHPSRPGQGGTLANGIASYYEMSGQACRVRHIHRLDEETTGPVLYAKNEWAQIRLDAAMREKRIERIYSALVEGRLPKRKGTVDAPIGKDRHHASRRRVSPTGVPAVTHYEVVESFDAHTWVRLRLETGRTHQIRVHLAHLGHPLIGDALYGGRPVAGMKRQALHGEKLRWIDPLTGEEREADAPFPSDFAETLEWLRNRSKS